jgi:hypothetical protein
MSVPICEDFQDRLDTHRVLTREKRYVWISMWDEEKFSNFAVHACRCTRAEIGTVQRVVHIPQRLRSWP